MCDCLICYASVSLALVYYSCFMLWGLYCYICLFACILVVCLCFVVVSLGLFAALFGLRVLLCYFGFICGGLLMLQVTWL